MIPAQPYLPWKVSMTVLHTLAVSSSLIRFEHRRRTGRLWWDDYAAMVPALLESLTIITLWLRIRSFDPTLPAENVQHLKTAFSFINSFAFSSTMWWSRISIALAIIRITPVWSKTRIFVVGLPFAFILTWLGLLLAMELRCITDTAWQHVKADILICGPTYGVTVFSVSTDIVSDVLLVVFPLYRLWGIKLPQDDRRLVLFVFSTSILTIVAAVSVTIVSYGGFFTGPGALLVWLMMTHIEEAISLIACNLLVLISWGYQVFSRVNNVQNFTEHITPHWSSGRPHGDSTPTFVLTELSANRSSHSDLPIGLSSQLHAEVERSNIEEWKPACEAVDAISKPHVV